MFLSVLIIIIILLLSNNLCIYFQIVSESIGIPGSLVKLTYRSSQSAGYLSCVHVQLTRRVVPASLIRVHVRVEIEGSLHTHTYEADPDLTHIFAWNKRNVYKQKVKHVYLY